MDSSSVITAIKGNSRNAYAFALLVLFWTIATSTVCMHGAAHAQSPGGRPSSNGPLIPTSPQATETYQAYSLKHVDAGDVEPLLREILSQQQETIHIVVNSQANQILLQGPPVAQQVAAELICIVDQPKATSGSPVAQALAGEPGLLATYSVTSGSSRDVAAQLNEPYVDSPQVRIAADPHHDLVLKVLHVRSETIKLISQPSGRLRSYPATNAGSSRNSTTTGFPLLSQSPFARSLFTGATAKKVATKSGINQRAQIANFLAEQDHSSVIAAQFEGEAAADEAADAQQSTPDKLLRQLGLDVDIEVLPDLDVIILRGRDDEVERVADIIREIEQIADEAESQIEIVPLQHTHSGALATLIQSTSTTLLKGRQGRATVISLDTPNALLLIGWGEAFGTVRGLIGKLDMPVAPDTQMQLFRLQHANATQVGRSVQQYFSSRTGLGAKVNAIVDQRSNSLIVHAAPRDMLEVAKLIEQLDVAEAATSERVRIFQLSHTLASDLASTITSAVASVRGTGSTKSANLEILAVDAEGKRIIKSGILDHVNITPNTQTNTLVVTAPVESMDLVAALIGQLDQPTSTAQIKVFRIINGDANSMVIMLRSLLPTQTGSNSRPQLPGSEGETSLAPLRFSVERRTNSIIASGSTGDLRIIEALLMRLDENEMKRRRNTVYRLRNAPATDVARAINEFLISQQRIQRLAPGELSPFQLIESEVVVVPEPVSNTLIISATTRFYKDIMELIERLDAQPPQVMIQVLIAEVALGDVDEFGVELGLQDSVLFDRSLLSELTTTTNSTSGSTPAGIITDTNEIIQGATNIPGFLFNSTGPLGNSGSDRSFNGSNRVGAQGIANFGVGRINNDLGFGGLVLAASSESVSVLIRALHDSRRLEVLSRPQIMTLDNQPAFVQVGQRVPYITDSQLTNFGVINQVTLEDVGLILGVTPRISPEGMVVMEVDAEKSQVGPVEDGIPISTTPDGEVINAPKIDITTAQTTVSCASGETIVLGGLITKRTKNIHRRVPLLADIPLLGDLFRYDLVDVRRTELLIILTPQVILGPEDQLRLKQIESARMSWCAADVNALLDNGIYGEASLLEHSRKIPIIYPDQNPRGLLDPDPDDLSRGETEDVESQLNLPMPLPEVPLPEEDSSSDSERVDTDGAILPTYWNKTGTPLPPQSTSQSQPSSTSARPKSKFHKSRWNPMNWIHP